MNSVEISTSGKVDIIKKIETTFNVQASDLSSNKIYLCTDATLNLPDPDSETIPVGSILKIMRHSNYGGNITIKISGNSVIDSNKGINKLRIRQTSSTLPSMIELIYMGLGDDSYLDTRTTTHILYVVNEYSDSLNPWVYFDTLV